MSKKIKEGQVVTTAKNTESESEDNEDVLEEYECQEDEEHLTGISQTVLDKISVCHPITYDVYNICKLTHNKKLSSFKVKMLKEIYNHFELSFKSRDIKADNMNKIEEMVQGCSCNTELTL